MAKMTRRDMLKLSGKVAAAAAAGAAGYEAVMIVQRQLGQTAPTAATVQPARPVSPELRTWRRVASFDSGLVRPVGIAWAGHALVAAGDRRLRFFDSSGAFQREHQCGQMPLAITGRPDGSMLAVLDGGDGSVQRIAALDSDGDIVHAAELPPGGNVVSLASGNDRVFAADFGRRTVWILDEKLKMIGEVHPAGQDESPSHHFIVPSPYFAMAVGADGLLRVANPGRFRVELYDDAGRALDHWGCEGSEIEAFSGCCNPCSIAMLPGGELVTAEKGALPALKIYGRDGGRDCSDQRGKLQAVLAGAGELPPANRAFSVAASPDGQVCLLHLRTGQIDIYRVGAAPAGSEART